MKDLNFLLYALQYSADLLKKTFFVITNIIGLFHILFFYDVSIPIFCILYFSIFLFKWG